MDETVTVPSWPISIRWSSVSAAITRDPWLRLNEAVVETADKVNGKKYKQIFSQNMGKKGEPKVGRLQDSFRSLR